MKEWRQIQTYSNNDKEIIKYLFKFNNELIQKYSIV